jgi:hypothetical protein
MAFRERHSGVSFGFIFSSVSWLPVFFSAAPISSSIRATVRSSRWSAGFLAGGTLPSGRFICGEIGFADRFIDCLLGGRCPQGRSIAIGGKRQNREQVAQFKDRFYRNQRRAERELRALRTHHPTWNRIDPVVHVTIDAFAVTVSSARSNR